MSYSINIEHSELNNLQCGENNHPEFGWSKMIKERILQFYFQLVRVKDKSKLIQLDTIYSQLLFDVITSNITKEVRIEYLNILYKMIGYTRDIKNGKGEYQLSYMMISCWLKLQSNICRMNTNNQFKNIDYITSDMYHARSIYLAYYVLKHFVSVDKDTIDTDTDTHPIGSYKDIKYFINYWRDLWKDSFLEDKYMNADIVVKLIELANSKLKEDLYIINHLNNNTSESHINISLISKWIPREKSNKFGWMTRYFAIQYFTDEKWFVTADTPIKQCLAEKKALTLYRKLLSKANRFIDTTQIKQCSGNWKDIDFDKGVTSITMFKQKYAFLNKKNNEVRYRLNEDRIKCSDNYKQYIKKCKEYNHNHNHTIKGKHVSIYDFVKAADIINTPSYDSDDILDLINLQWKDNSTINTSFNHLIAMVDTSDSMTRDRNMPLYNAIGLGIRISERSTLGKRILTFNNNPTWVNLDDCTDFVSCVKKVKQAPWGMNTNFYNALDLILDAYVSMDLHPNDVEKYGLVILSDMQIDECSVCNYSDYKINTMFSEIESRFAEVGMNSKYKTPYTPPFIIFWNLTKTNGFPSTSLTKNVAMVSGYSPVLLNQFLERGIEAFKDYNPWDIMISTLEHPRYKHFGDCIVKTMANELE